MAWLRWHMVHHLVHPKWNFTVSNAVILIPQPATQTHKTIQTKYNTCGTKNNGAEYISNLPMFSTRLLWSPRSSRMAEDLKLTTCKHNSILSTSSFANQLSRLIVRQVFYMIIASLG